MKLSELIKQGTESLNQYGDIDVALSDWMSEGGVLKSAQQTKVVDVKTSTIYKSEVYNWLIPDFKVPYGNQRHLKPNAKVFFISENGG